MTDNTVSPDVSSTTPESILARFAAEYREHGEDEAYRLQISFDRGGDLYGYPESCGTGWKILYHGGWTGFVNTKALTRIDYSNARYRGAQPLWEREG